MGGTSDGGAFSYRSRYIHPTSKLGYHAPLLQVSKGNYTKKSVEAAYSIAVKSISLLTKKADELNISKHLINIIANTTGENFFYIKQIKDLAFLDILLYGYKTPKKTNKSRMALCSNLWNLKFDIYDQPKEFTAAKLKAPKSKLGRNGKVMIFYPWEGEAYCDTLFDKEYGGGNLDKVVISEFEDFSDIRADGTYSAWARLPFSSLITELEIGNTRDF